MGPHLFPDHSRIQSVAGSQRTGHHPGTHSDGQYEQVQPGQIFLPILCQKNDVAGLGPPTMLRKYSPDTSSGTHFCNSFSNPTTLSGVRFIRCSSLTKTHGAPSQAPIHSANSRLTLPS